MLKHICRNHETVKQQERNGCATMLLQLSNCSVTIVQLLQLKRTQYNSETFMQQSWSIKEEEEIKKMSFFSLCFHMKSPYCIGPPPPFSHACGELWTVR